MNNKLFMYQAESLIPDGIRALIETVISQDKVSWDWARIYIKENCEFYTDKQGRVWMEACSPYEYACWIEEVQLWVQESQMDEVYNLLKE